MLEIGTKLLCIKSVYAAYTKDKIYSIISHDVNRMPFVINDQGDEDSIEYDIMPNFEMIKSMKDID